LRGPLLGSEQGVKDVKQFVLSALDHLGIEAQRSTTLRRFFATHSIDLVVDAGANLGQFGNLIRRKGYRGRIWSFEPIGHVYDALRQVTDANWKASRIALGSTPGHADLNVCVNHSLSSFLPVLGNQGFAGTESVTERVAVDTLDNVLRGDPAASIFLKADVQGFEKQVLEGAAETLKRTQAIYLELPVEHLYEGSWSFPEAIHYLDALGFAPAQFRTVSPLPTDRSAAFEFDCLFRRKGSLMRV
jgi:FkbM family methyltransferase